MDLKSCLCPIKRVSGEEGSAWSEAGPAGNVWAIIGPPPGGEQGLNVGNVDKCGSSGIM